VGPLFPSFERQHPPMLATRAWAILVPQQAFAMVLRG
jgi:hypothetical protein